MGGAWVRDYAGAIDKRKVLLFVYLCWSRLELRKAIDILANDLSVYNRISHGCHGRAERGAMLPETCILYRSIVPSVSSSKFPELRSKAFISCCFGSRTHDIRLQFVLSMVKSKQWLKHALRLRDGRDPSPVANFLNSDQRRLFPAVLARGHMTSGCSLYYLW